MADEKNTVHTEYTGSVNLKAAAAELAEFSSKFGDAFKQMDKALSAIDAKALTVARKYNKAVSSFNQARNNLQAGAVQPDRLGAKSRADVNAEAASRAADIDSYRRKVSKALAGTALEIDEQIKSIEKAYERLASSKRNNHKKLSQLDAELDTLRSRSKVIRSNSYVAEELTGARSARARAALRAAAADDTMSTRAAEALAAAKMRLIAVEGMLQSAGAKKGNRTAELQKEQTQLQELVRTYEAVTSVVQKYNQNFKRNLSTEVSKNDRRTVGDARQVLQLEERLGVIKAQIAKSEIGEARLDAMALSSLRTELTYSQQLLALHQQDADVMARAAVIRERATNKALTAANTAMRAEANLMNKDFDRVAKRSEAERLRAAGLDKLTQAQAKADNAEFTRLQRLLGATKELARQRRLGIDKETQDRANADNKELDRLLKLLRATQEKDLAKKNALIDYTRAMAEADNAEYNRVLRAKRLRESRNDPGVAAGNYIRNEELRLKIEAQVLRLKQSGTTEDRVQLNLLDQELVRLRQEAAELMKIQGIEARISSERARRQVDTKGDTKSRLQSIRQNPGELMGIQAELMGNYAAFGAIQGAVRNMVTYVVQGETALTKFQAIASASNIETAALANTMEELGANSKYTNLEIIETATVLAQAGLSARDTGPALQAIGKLATAAGIELKQAADVVTSVSNIWGYGTSEMGNVANILTAALNKTKLSMDQMQLGIQYAGNIAVDAGIDFVELTAAMGALAQAGIRSGSTIGTGLRALITDLQKPNEKMLATMERLGVGMEEVDLKTLGFTQVLTNLKAAGFGSADALGAFEVRAAASFTALTNNLSTLEDLQGSLYGTKAATEASALQMTTLTARWTSFVNAAQSVAKDGFGPVIAAVKAFLQVGTAFLNLLNKVPGAAAVVTTGFVVMFGALAVTKLALATAALNTMITSTAALGTTSALTAGAVSVLSKSLYGLPVIGWIAAAAGLAAGFFSIATGMRKTGDEADKIKADINDLTSRMQENQQTTRAVEGALERLNRQYGVLTDNGPMRDRTLETARQRFESLGLKIDESTNSVDGMIQAIQKLRNELRQDFASQLFALAAKMRLEIDELNKDLDEDNGVSKETGDRFTAAFRTLQQRGEGASTQPGQIGPSWEQQSPLGPIGRRAQDIVSGRVQVSESMRAQLRTDIQGATLARRQNQDYIDNRRPGVTDEQIENARLRLTALDRAIGVFGESISSLDRIANRATEAADSQTKALYDMYMSNTATAGYSFKTGVELSTTNRFSARVQDIQTSKASLAERTRQADLLEGDAQAYKFELLERIKTVIAQGVPPEYAKMFEDEMKALITKAIQDVAITPLNDLREANTNAERRTGGAERAAENNSRNAGQALELALAEANEAALEAALRRAQAERTSATSAEARAAATAEYNRIFPILEAKRLAALEAEMQNEAFFDEDSTHVRPHGGATTSRMQPSRTINGVTRPHHGIDIDGQQGDSIKAATGGTITSAGLENGYGNVIRIKNDDGTSSLYAHLSQIDVRAGRVDRGQQIGLMGGDPGTPGAGNSDGSHLHYELRDADGRRIDPEGYRGRIGGSTGQNADFEEMRRLRRNEARLESETQKIADDRAADRFDRTQTFIPAQREMKARQRANGASIDSLIDGLKTGGDETTIMSEVIAAVRAKIADNMQIAVDLLNQDPANDDLKGTPDFENRIVAEQIRVMLEGADKIEEAYEAQRAVQQRISDDRLAFVADETRKADAMVGTSATTMWLLERRQELEAYQAAQRELVANQMIYTETMKAVAEAELAVAAANAALTASVGEEAITKAGAAVELARETLARAQQTARAASVQVAGSYRSVEQSRPVGPMPASAARATAAGPDWINNPIGAMGDVIDRYRSTSGIMAGISQTITSGIENSFTALSQGINDTINQIADGSITIQGLFANLFGGVLKELQATAAKIATNFIMQWIIKTIAGSMMPGAGGGSMDAQGMSMLNRGSMPGLPGLALGGTPRRRALGGGGQPGRDSIHTLVEPGEVTMRKSAVDFIGRDNLLSLNAMGNTRLSAAAGRMPAMAPREPDMVNVWLAAPSQIPPPSKKDIVLMVGESMLHGDLKKMVKQVAVGG